MLNKSNETLIELKKQIRNGEHNLFDTVLYGILIDIRFIHRMAEKKREAEAAVDLMSVQYERNRSEEEKRNGLLIISATYGKIVDDSSSGSSEFSALIKLFGY